MAWYVYKKTGTGPETVEVPPKNFAGWVIHGPYSSLLEAQTYADTIDDSANAAVVIYKDKEYLSFSGEGALDVSDRPDSVKTITVTYTEWGEYHYFASFCVSFGERGKRMTEAEAPPLAIRRMWADGVLIYSYIQETVLPGIVWHYREGWSDQDPIPGYDLAYRDLILVAFVDFPLGTSPSGLPTISAEFDDGSYTSGEALTQFSIRAGFDEADINVVGLEDELIGYILGGGSTLEGVAVDLGLLYNFSMQETAGVVTYRSNYEAGELVIDATVPAGELGVISENNTQIDIIARQSDQSLPKRLKAHYFNVDANYEEGLERAERSSGPVKTHSSTQEVSVQLPIVGHGEDIRSRLFDALYRYWRERNGHSLRLLPEFLAVDPGEVLAWSSYGSSYAGQIVKTTINADWSITMSTVEREATYSAIQVDTQDLPNSPVTLAAADVFTAVFDVPDTAADQVQEDYLNTRVGMGAIYPATFAGGRLDMSVAGQPGSWLPRVLWTAEEEVGIAQLDEAPEADADVLVVRINNLLVEDFENRVGEHIVVGTTNKAEILTYTTVTDMTGGIVELSGLTRGLFDTYPNQGMHNADDFLCFYDDLSIVPYPAEDYREHGHTYLYRGVANYQLTSEAEVVPYKLSGNSRKPYAPINIDAERVNGDIIITWDEVDRFTGEPDDIYAVDIYDANWMLKRRINNIAAKTINYFVEWQVQDDTDELTELNVLVYQVNASHTGRGFPGRATLDVSVPVEGDDFQGLGEIDLDGYGRLQVPLKLQGVGEIDLDGYGNLNIPVNFEIANHTKAVQSTAVTTHPIAFPSGIAAGDLLLLHFSNGISAGTRTLPSGFTAVQQEQGSRVGGILASKIADGSETGSVNVTTAGACGSVTFMLRITGHDGIDQSSEYRNEGNTDRAYALSITPSENGCMLIMFGTGGWGNLNTTWTPQGAFAELDEDESNVADDNGTTGAVQWQIQATAAATGNTEYVFGPFGLHSYGILVAIKPL